MLIGISGKKGHGKDTVFTIINCIDKGLSDDLILNTLEGTYDGLGYNYTFDNVKFAGVIKTMIMSLLDCEFHNLESEEFKNRPVWGKYEVEVTDCFSSPHRCFTMSFTNSHDRSMSSR